MQGARILLFGYMFYHVYLHYDQVSCKSRKYVPLKFLNKLGVSVYLITNVLIGWAGHPDAPLWISVGLCCTSSASNNELDVVWKDYQGVDEAISEDAMMHIYVPTKSNVFPLRWE